MTRRAVIFAPGSRAQDRACRSRLPGLALFAFAAFLIVFLGAAFLGAVFLAAGLAAGLAAVRGMFVGLWSPPCCFLKEKEGGANSEMRATFIWANPDVIRALQHFGAPEMRPRHGTNALRETKPFGGL